MGATAVAHGPVAPAPISGARHLLDQPGDHARPGWSAGNALVVIITGTGKRTAEAFDGTFAPVLHVHVSHRLIEVRTPVGMWERHDPTEVRSGSPKHDSAGTTL